MTSETTVRRARNVAALGFVLQTLACGTLAAVALWSSSDAIMAVARFVLAGLPIWGILFLLFKQMRRVGSEALETAELKRAQESGASSAIFEVEDEELLVERDRLGWMVKWLLPSVTVLVSLYLIGGHFFAWSWALSAAFDKGGLSRTADPTLVVWIIVGVGFLSFLYARYALALSRIVEWRALHAGATCMAGTALACLILALALFASTTLEWVEPLVASVVRVVLVVIGLELAVNFVLDFYRPRVPGEVPRPSFDSRLLGLLSEPGGIAKSVADAINYQFGFEVSSTWFYQLLQRWMLPLTVLTLLLVMLLSGIVVVDADQQAVVERLGRPITKPREVLDPGLHLKWPYPFDVTYRAPAKRVSELIIGEAVEEAGDEHAHKAIVWTEAHEYVPELLLLVASPKLAQLSKEETREGLSSGTESVAVSLLMASVPIKYRIKDIKKFLYNYADPVKLLEGVAYQYLSEYAAGVDIDRLMGPGRQEFNARLERLIQERLDELETGIEIVFAGVRDAHPPSTERVAEAFQGVVSAQINMDALVHAAEGEAQRILTNVAGTEARAKLLDEAIKARDQLETEGTASSEQVAAARQRVDELLSGSSEKGIAALSGEAAAMIAAEQARSSEWVSQESAKVQAFNTEVVAFEASPSLYTHRKFLTIYDKLDHVRKFLIEGDPSSVIIEYETVEGGGLDRVLSEGIAEEKAK